MSNITMDCSTSPMHINDLPTELLRQQLQACCAADRWVRHMIAGRPYQSAGQMLDRSTITWPKLLPADWLDALVAAGSQMPITPDLSTLTGRLLSTVCDRYEAIFGYPLVYSEPNPSPEQVLATARQRLENDQAEELIISAEHIKAIAHRKLMALYIA